MAITLASEVAEGGSIVQRGKPLSIDGPVGSAALKPGDVVYFDGTDWELADQNVNEVGYTCMVGVVLYRTRIGDDGGRKTIDDQYETTETCPVCIGPKTLPFELVIKIDTQNTTPARWRHWRVVDTALAQCSVAGTLTDVLSADEGGAAVNKHILPFVNKNPIAAADDRYAEFAWSGL